MSEIRCECCHAEMIPRFWNIRKKEGAEIYKCPKCKLYWAPHLQMDSTFRSRLDESQRVSAIARMRETEFQDVVKNIKQYSQGNRLLEVGCSYGWFMEIAKKEGFDIEGIEPEKEIAQQARKSGLNVMTGYFPNDIRGEGGYHAIIFNNVWEHINHSCEMIDACGELLASDTNGLLLITVPLSSGILFRISALLERIGITEYMARLWQLHFHSPHIYFFTKKNMNRFFNPKGYRLIAYKEVRSIDPSKMKQRFLMDQTERFAGMKAAIFTIAWTVLSFFPADKALFVYERSKAIDGEV